MAMIGNKLRISPSMFNVFKDMSQGVNYNPLVEEDIPRTFPHLNDLFEEIQPLSMSLREILQAYQNFRPDIGYIQGMSYVAGIILLHCGPPEDCFRVFCNLLNSELVLSFYDFDLRKINKVYKIFWKLLRETTP